MTLEELLKANGVAEETISAVLNGMKENKIYTTSEENLDIRYNKLKGDFDNLTEQHGQATTLIEQLKKGAKNNEEMQGQITAYETQVEDLQKQLKQTQLESEIKVALLVAKATDVDYMIYKLKEKGELELGEDGKIKGIDDKIAGLKVAYPNQFENGKPNKVEPNRLPQPNHNEGITKEAFDKMGYQERLQVYKENPDAYAEFTK